LFTEFNLALFASTLTGFLEQIKHSFSRIFGTRCFARKELAAMNQTNAMKVSNKPMKKNIDMSGKYCD